MAPGHGTEIRPVPTDMAAETAPPARLPHIRAVNTRMIMEMVRGAGRISRAELSRASGLSKPTVSSIMRTLEKAGIVQVAGCGQGRAGRAPVLYEIRPNLDWVLGGEIRGGGVRLAISRASDPRRLSLEGQLTAAHSGHRASQLVGLIDELSGRAGVATHRLTFAAFAMSQPTEVPQATGESQHQADFAALRDALDEALGARYTIEHAAHMAALAEYRRRGCEPPRSLAFVSVGAQIDLGLVLSGRIHRGAHYQPGRRAGLVTSLAEVSMERRALLSAQFLCQLIGLIDPELILLGGPLAREPGFSDTVKVLAQRLAGGLAADIETSTMADPVLGGCVALAADQAWHRALVDPTRGAAHPSPPAS
jgi:predicted NBD/HSP70 family sugar kinase